MKYHNGLYGVLIIILIWISSSCSVKYHCKRCPIQTKDSTITVVRDSIIEKIDTAYVADSTSMKLLVECDSLGEAHISMIQYLQNNPKIKIKYKYVDNIISTECVIDSLEVYSRYRTHFKQMTKESIKILEKPAEKYIPKFFIWVLVISLGINIVMLLWKIFKPKFL